MLSAGTLVKVKTARSAQMANSPQPFNQIKSQLAQCSSKAIKFKEPDDEMFNVIACFGNPNANRPTVIELHRCQAVFITLLI